MKVFFIGIGGISMSALAVILKKNGYDVVGSDSQQSDVTINLENNGVKVYIGHKKEHIDDDIELLVYSSAIHEDNEELKTAREKNIECIQRSKLLGFIMKNYKNAINIAGTHGKTTITSMIAKVLVDNNYEPTVTVGGNLKDIGGNLYIGNNNDLFVAEACEYTNSFLDFFPTIEVISNIDNDHLDFFKNIDNIRSSFKKFIDTMDNNGILIINKNIRDINFLIKDFKGKVFTYGIDCDADYVAKNIMTENDGESFDLYKNNNFVSNIKLSIFGKHNVENSVAAIACLMEYGININNISNIINKFAGCDRRLQNLGIHGGIKFIDDYAHHPNEIKESLKALKEMRHKKLYIIFQPHTYSRTEMLFNEFVDVFKDVDNLIMIDIYAARENNINNISSEDVIKEINKKYDKTALYKKNFDDAVNYIESVIEEGDTVVTMGAGDVYKVGESLINYYNAK